MSVRTVLHGIDPSKHTVLYLPNPVIGVRGIHEAIVTAFGQQPSHLGSRLTAQTGLALAAAREERGRTPVLVLDEAHLLSCLLVGQPTLRRTMKLAVLAALEQRTALRYTMPGMTSTETASYIKHHLGLAGPSDQLFTDDAVTLIHTTSRGFPRANNNLCLQSLVATFAAGKSLVDEKAAQSAVTEVLD
ncbi:hypothetical protein OG607_44670 [Streptomyces sp. NBC_01537]|uniref:ExeA family protein n=1 Tax=Streptomyces sp. NBC_01537 TaxID=2903896 RepID=UPI0038701C90